MDKTATRIWRAATPLLAGALLAASSDAQRGSAPGVDLLPEAPHRLLVESGKRVSDGRTLQEHADESLKKVEIFETTRESGGANGGGLGVREADGGEIDRGGEEADNEVDSDKARGAAAGGAGVSAAF